MALLHNPQRSLSVFHSTDCSWFPSTRANSTWTTHWNLPQSDCSNPSLPQSSTRANSSPDPPVLKCMVWLLQFRVIWCLCPLQPCQSASDLGVIVSVSCTSTGHWFVLLPFQFVEECLKLRPRVRTRTLGTVCPDEAQQCFHAMLLRQPSWPTPLDCRFCSAMKLCLEPGATKIPFLYLGSLNILRSTSGVRRIRVGFLITTNYT